MDINNIPLLISGFAVTISLITLWMTHLAPFNLVVTHGTPAFSLYKITPDISGTKDGKTWWIPSFDIGFSFMNSGKLSGKILDVRIFGLAYGHTSNEYYAFYPEWVVDFSRFDRNRGDRFAWLKEAVQRKWYPLPLPGQKDTHVHLILEGIRWEKKFEKMIHLKLEIATSQNASWAAIAEYDLPITRDMFERKGSMILYDPLGQRLRKI